MQAQLGACDPITHGDVHGRPPGDRFGPGDLELPAVIVVLYGPAVGADFEIVKIHGIERHRDRVVGDRGEGGRARSRQRFAPEIERQREADMPRSEHPVGSVMRRRPGERKAPIGGHAPRKPPAVHEFFKLIHRRLPFAISSSTGPAAMNSSAAGPCLNPRSITEFKKNLNILSDAEKKDRYIRRFLGSHSSFF